MLHSSCLVLTSLTQFIRLPRPKLFSTHPMPLGRTIALSTWASSTVIGPSVSKQSKDVPLLSAAVLPPYVFSTPPPEVALLLLFFVLSMAAAAGCSMIIISIPTITAFRRLSTSMEKLVQVFSEEVPGTLKLLKLFGQEIYDLTQLLSKLRQMASASDHINRDGANNSTHFRN